MPERAAYLVLEQGVTEDIVDVRQFLLAHFVLHGESEEGVSRLDHVGVRVDLRQLCTYGTSYRPECELGRKSTYHACPLTASLLPPCYLNSKLY